VLSGRAFLRCGLVAAGFVTLFAPNSAAAQTGDDPAAGSPPRAVYQIPLEGARRDAAPRKGDSDAGPAGTGGSGGSTSGSTYRSENNFGSSSHIPGAAAAVTDPQPSVDEGETSVPAAVSLLALIAVAGVGIGVIAGRSRRGS
jgi:hypothetical protein